MKKRYWSIKSERGLLTCACPWCGITKSIIRIGKYKVTKCPFCHRFAWYKKADVKRFNRGYRR